jgi:formylglycine-generating enzyme required for sulfatase activity
MRYHHAALCVCLLAAAVPVQAQKKDDPPPEPTVAPFDAKQAEEHQKAWAKHLGVRVKARNSIGMDLMLIPPGEFLMGSPAFEEGRQGDETQHKVTLTKPFFMGITEVTQLQFFRVLRKNPSNFKAAKHPVEQVTWDEAVEFCARLSDLPAEKRAGRVYRLPTEAEWEYACRAGTTTAYSFGNDQGQLSNYGWWHDYKVNSGGATHPVGLKKPNPWGLYDIHGNVFELCHDWYVGYSGGELTDPKGPVSGPHRVNRGGCWLHDSGRCRSAYRGRITPDTRYYDLGFRVLRSSIK